MTISTRHLGQITQVIYPQGKLNDFKILTGGISAQTIRLDITFPNSQTQKVVLRQHGEIDRQRNPNIAQDEFRLLKVLHDGRLPVPKTIYVDSSNTILDLPYLVIEYIEHDETLFSLNQIRQVAEILHDIHQVDLAIHDLSFLPDQMRSLKARLKQPPSDKTQHIHDALTQTLPHLKLNKTVLLHGDYWLGNVLWRDGEVVGVIDWEDMMRGDPLVDLGKSRLEILWQFGLETMQAYTTHYQSLMPQLNYTYLPFWDLYGAIRLTDFAIWFDDADKIQILQQKYDGFVDNAIRQL